MEQRAHLFKENNLPNFGAGGILPASRQAFVEFLDGTGTWSRYASDEAGHCNGYVSHNVGDLTAATPQVNIPKDHQELHGPQNVQLGLDQVFNQEAVGTLASHDSGLFCPPLSSYFNFGEYFTSPTPTFGVLDFSPIRIGSNDDDGHWNIEASSKFINESFDIGPFPAEIYTRSPVQRSITLRDDDKRLAIKGSSSLPAIQDHFQGARSFVVSLVKHAKETSREHTRPPLEPEMPDVEDIIDSLKSLIPEETPSFGHSGLTLVGKNTISSSDLFKTLLYSFTNNFAGLGGVPRRSLLQLLREHYEVRTHLFEVVKSGPPGVAKSLADNLFRASVEGCDPDAVATILHHTRKDPRIAIDLNEVACNFEGRDYTPIELAAKFRNIELVRTLLASRPDPNKTFLRQLDIEKEPGALALALRRWEMGSTDLNGPRRPPSEPPEPVDLDFLRMLLDCGAEVRIDLVENAIRPGPGHTAIAEELISRIPATDHHICFNSECLLVSIIHYLDNSAADRIIRCLFAQCLQSIDCGKCVSEDSRQIEKMLCHAARRSNSDLSKFLVQYTTQLQSALAAAVRGGDAELVDFLLDRGARVDDPVESWGPEGRKAFCCDFYDEDGYDIETYAPHFSKHIATPIRTPLAEAIRAKDDHLIATFERRGALNRLAEKHHFHAAILAAAEVGNIPYLRLILGHASELPNQKNLALALAVAIRRDETDAALVLLDAGASTHHDECFRYGNPLVDALTQHNKRVVDAMLECDVSLHHNTYANRDFPMEVAGAWGDLDVIEDMIRMGASINLGHQMTALEAAVRSQNQTLFHRLLELGAKPGACSATGTFPLQAAVEIGDHDMVRLLLSKWGTLGPPLSFVSVFVYAMKNDRIAYDLLLSEFKSRVPYGLREFGGDLLVKAIELNNPDLFDDLLTAGINVNSGCRYHPWNTISNSIDPISSGNNRRVLGLAIKQDRGRNYELVRKLMDARADANSFVDESLDEWDGQVIGALETPLHVAIKVRNTKMISLLLGYGAEINRPARRGAKRTPLQAACETGSYEIVEFLLLHGAKANDSAAERYGGTALQMAAKTGSIKIIKLLLDNGADPHMAKSKVGGRTAFEAAAENGCIDILCVLWNAVLPHGFGEKECESAKSLAKQKGHRGCFDFIHFLQSNVGSGSFQSLLHG